MTTPWNFNPTAIAGRLRKLRRARRITPAQHAIGDTLLWSCRAPGKDAAMVSYDRLATLAGVGRTTAVEAVRVLRGLGCLIREKTRLRVAWSLGTASRQGRNIYRWIAAPTTECTQRPTDQTLGRKQEARERKAAVAAALEAVKGLPNLLAARRAALEARWRELAEARAK